MSTEPTSPAAKKNRLPAIIVAAGAAAGLTLAGFGISSAQTDSSTSTTPPAASSSDQAPAASDAKPPRHTETALTGDTAEKVKAAALEAVPGGTVLRVETDDDGSPYEAHVRKTDGTEVVVKLDADFKVTSVDEFGGRGPGGPGGRHHDGDGPDDSTTTDAPAATTTN